MKDDHKKLSRQELDQVVGGVSPAEEYETDEAYEYCHGEYEYGKHQWVKTGNHKEEPFFFFWTRGYDEYRCSKCGATKWEH